MKRRGTTSSLIGLLIAGVAWLTAPAHATQYLVRAGENWERYDARLKPGDEIILMPGRHRPATLNNARGTADKPIVIRGLDAAHPALIDADRYGIRLRQPRHVRLADLAISGATIHGITLTAPAPAEDPPAGSITITRVTITDTGPKGLRHAINLERLTDVRIRSCRIEGWAGSGIEIIGCDDVAIMECRFIGKEDHAEVSGIRIRAGGNRILVDQCRFENPGVQAVCIGSESRPGDFASPPPADAKPRTLFEASRVEVKRSIMVGGECAVALVNCAKANVHHCTIVRPRYSVVSIRQDQQDVRFGAASECQFDNNLVTWEPGDLNRLAHLGKGANTGGVTLEQNLWWTNNWEEVKAGLGPFPGTERWPQVTDIDPKLNSEFRPTNEAAELFGSEAP